MSRPESTRPPSIPGYDCGASTSGISPVTRIELTQLEENFGWTCADADVLSRYADLFRAKPKKGSTVGELLLARNRISLTGLPNLMQNRRTARSRRQASVRAVGDRFRNAYARSGLAELPA